MDVEIFSWLDIWNFFEETQGGLCPEVHNKCRVGRGQGGRGSENKTEVSAHACVCVLILGIGEWCLSPSYICVVKWHTIIPQSLLCPK